MSLFLRDLNSFKFSALEEKTFKYLSKIDKSTSIIIDFPLFFLIKTCLALELDGLEIKSNSLSLIPN